MSLNGANSLDLLVGDQLRALRERAGRRIDEAAERLGLPVQAYRELELGVRRVRARQVYELAHFLDANVSEFYALARTI
jgi:transcriptional regulator with XRE-family HTH domain